MASFLDTLMKIVLLVTQIYAVYTAGELFEKIKVEMVMKERNFSENRQKHNDWLTETGHPTEFLTNSIERYIPDFRKVQRARKFWNGIGGLILFLTFVFMQLVACFGYFNVDLAPGWR